MQAILVVVLIVRILSQVGCNYIFSCPSLVCINVDLFLLFIHMNCYDFCLFWSLWTFVVKGHIHRSCVIDNWPLCIFL